MTARSNIVRFLAAKLTLLAFASAACNALLDIPEYQPSPDGPNRGGGGGDGDEGSGGSGATGKGGAGTGAAGNDGGAGAAGDDSGGGSDASGGAVGTGGSSGSGGTGGTGSGGTSGSGGSSGSSGSSGSGGATGSPCQFESGDYTFETSSTEGFSIEYAEPQSLLNSSSLAGEAGSLRMRIGFDGEQQEFDAAAAQSPALDLRGKVITACVRLVSNVDDSPELPAIELLAASGEDQDHAYSSAKRFMDNEWFVLELLADLPSREDGPYDPSDTRWIGFSIWTDFGTYGNVIVDVDGIKIR